MTHTEGRLVAMVITDEPNFHLDRQQQQGRLRRASSNQRVQKLVLSTICARMIKNIINKRMRITMKQVRAPADTVCYAMQHVIPNHCRRPLD
jgi:hypothetical protein